MSLWVMLLCCWVFGSLPLAVLVGKMLAGGQQPSVVPALSMDVDATLDRIFADAALRRTS